MKKRMLVIEREVVVHIEELKNGTHAAGRGALLLLGPPPSGGGGAANPVKPLSAHG